MNDRESRDAEIVRLAGLMPPLTYREIGASVGLSKSGVRQMLQRRGVRSAAVLAREARTAERAERARARSARLLAREARDAEIVRLARSEPSLTLVQIGARVGLSDSAVARLLDRAGVERPTWTGAHRGPLPTAGQAVVAFRRAGSTVDAAAALGVSRPWLSRTLAAQGSAPADLRVRRIERAEALYRTGLSLKEVGAHLDVSFATVANLLREAQVPTLPRGSGGWPREKRAEWVASRTAVPVGR